MAYLFGDSTPFPMDVNFVEAVSSVIDTTVGLLRIGGRLEHCRQRAIIARGVATENVARVDALAEALAEALQGHVNEADPVAGQAAIRIFEAARVHLEQARRDGSARGDGELRAVENEVALSRAELLRCCESFLCRWEFPGTVWRQRWNGGAGDVGPQASACATTPFGLEARMDLGIPPDHRLARPFRVAGARKGIELALPAVGSLLRRARIRKESLDTYFVCEIESSPERAALRLRRRNSPLAAGLWIVLRDQGTAGVTVRRFGEDGQSAGEAVYLEGTEATSVMDLWSEAERALEDLSERRRSLSSASFEGTAIGDLERPEQLAARMIGAVAPLVREVRRRGTTSNELSLKREMGNGRREEIYVCCDEILARYQDLPPGQRQIFAPFELDTSQTQPIRASDLIDGDEAITSIPRRGPRLATAV